MKSQFRANFILNHNMSDQQRRRDEDEAVRKAFREHGPFNQRWPIPIEDLEAIVYPEYDTNEGSESSESLETAPLLAGRNARKSTPGSYAQSALREVLESDPLVQRRNQSRECGSNPRLVRSKCTGLGWVVLGLLFLGILYLGFPTLMELFFKVKK